MNEINDLISRARLAQSFSEYQSAIALLELAHQKYKVWWMRATSFQKFKAIVSQIETNLLLEMDSLRSQIAKSSEGKPND